MRIKGQMDTDNGTAERPWVLAPHQVAAYLARIGYDGDCQPTPQTLQALQRAHLLNVPFDNLDIMAARPLVCDLGGLYDKIVGQRRGGICYELNSLFAALLRSLGFTVEIYSARIPGELYNQDFDHLLLGVPLAGQLWLADTGFGRGSFLEPILLQPGLAQEDARGSFRIARIETATKPDSATDADVRQPTAAATDTDSRQPEAATTDAQAGTWPAYQLYWQPPGGEPSLSYSFTTQPRALAEFVPRWTHFATAPDSRFRSNSLVAKDTPDGRISLTSDRLLITAGGQQQRIEIADEAAYCSALSEHFGITWPDGELPA
ncbi:MAG: arylamine N-acetyltransferase [Coriobacteriales bacterium]|jgi:N-hydroxyarylamine O-acetyltransferase|nr:arylamine N-acetyltransferase [Coriobacteriales bacterium]